MEPVCIICGLPHGEQECPDVVHDAHPHDMTREQYEELGGEA